MAWTFELAMVWQFFFLVTSKDKQDEKEEKISDAARKLRGMLEAKMTRRRRMRGSKR